MHDENLVGIQQNLSCVCAVHQITIMAQEYNDGKMSPNLQVVVFLLTGIYLSYICVRVCVYGNKRAMSHLLLYRFQFQRSYTTSEHSFSYVSSYSHDSSLLFIFPREFVLPCIVRATVLFVRFI